MDGPGTPFAGAVQNGRGRIPLSSTRGGTVTTCRLAAVALRLALDRVEHVDGFRASIDELLDRCPRVRAPVGGDGGRGRGVGRCRPAAARDAPAAAGRGERARERRGGGGHRHPAGPRPGGGRRARLARADLLRPRAGPGGAGRRRRCPGLGAAPLPRAAAGPCPRSARPPVAPAAGGHRRSRRLRPPRLPRRELGSLRGRRGAGRVLGARADRRRGRGRRGAARARPRRAGAARRPRPGRVADRGVERPALAVGAAPGARGDLPRRRAHVDGQPPGRRRQPHRRARSAAPPQR